jgi:hypothetical protein
VHTGDVRQWAARATDLGASLVGTMDEGYAVHRSPGGLTFCVGSAPVGRRPGPVSWPGGRSRVEQHWTTLADPAGRPYSVTGRDPGTGRLP